MGYYDDYEDDYMSPQTRYENKRAWAIKGHYESFLRRRNGDSVSGGWGYDDEGNWFEIRICSIDKRHKTLEEFDSYQRIRLAMGEPDTALEHWTEIRMTGKPSIVFDSWLNATDYCRDHKFDLREVP